MTDAPNPETLSDLLRTIERSNDLRALARECGLSVRELRRRLAIWRRELQADDEAVPAPLPAAKGARHAEPAAWPELPAAAHLADDPRPGGSADVLVIHTDGASRGNPGPAAVGVVFSLKDGPAVCVHSEAIGRATNNVAEYRAVVIALEHCRRWKIDRVHLLMDSELIVRQLHGAYRVKSPDLRPLYQQVVFLSRGLREFKVRHVRREENSHADAMANRALDV